MTGSLCRKFIVRFAANVMFVAAGATLVAVLSLPTVAADLDGDSKVPGIDQVDFNRDIRPILSENCFACHGNDENHRKAKLRLDHRDAAVKLNDGIAAIVPGKPADSEAYALITSDDATERMPPKKSGKALTAAQKLTIKRWIEQGAPYGKHWAFVKPQRKALPQVAMKDWPANRIDHFVLAKLEAKGLKPSREADRYHLIRRVYLDLIGLPPSPAQVDAFVNDKSADAYEKVIDQLFKSPRFGERWAQMWLDLARYADTMGYEKDLPRNIWAYRDWVIDAFNRDLPFDQFTIEQLAGDLLPNATNAQILATAFHRNTLTNQEGGTDDEEFRVAGVKDRVDTTMQVWMGLTMGCAKCHSHKYDPISMKEYYQFFALFNQTEDNDQGSDAPKVATPSPGQRFSNQALLARMNQLNAEAKKTELRLVKQRLAWEVTRSASPTWRVIKPEKVVSTGGATLKVQPDHSVLASGKTPDRDTYVFNGDVQPGKYSAIRVEALTHPSLGKQGPGRSGRDPNFVINEFTVEIQDGTDFKPVALHQARADFAQKNWAVGGAIDGKPKTGWAVSPQFSKPHAALFAFKVPLALKQKSRVRIRIVQNYGQKLTIGRLRLSVTAGDASKVALQSDDVFQILAKAPATRSDSDKALLANAFLQSQAESDVRVKDLLARMADVKNQLEAAKKNAPVTPIMRELAANRKRVTKIHTRGNFLDQGEVVAPGVPATFGRLASDGPVNRLGVARWLVHADNPLTARVQVNRFWARLFGTGLVLTEEDFGNQGSMPTHQALLDDLAVGFLKDGWSIKRLLRVMVTSSTYKQTSRVTAQLQSLDADNRLLGRGPRFRLEAETVRDQALAAAGLLSEKMFGPSVMPPQPGGVWQITYSGSKWVNATGEDRYRRGLYTFLRRTSPYPSMLTFDAGSREVCLIRRVRTNTPLQSLITLNDPVFVEAAGGLAKRLVEQGGKADADRAVYAFRLVAVRPASDVELKRVLAIYQTALKHFSKLPDQATQLIKTAGQAAPDKMEASSFAAWIVVSNMLINLDEVMMKG